MASDCQQGRLSCEKAEAVDTSGTSSVQADLEPGLNNGKAKKDSFVIEEFKGPFWQKVVNFGVELRGLEPVPPELRTDTRYVNILTLFSTTSIGLLP